MAGIADALSSAFNPGTIVGSAVTGLVTQGLTGTLNPTSLANSIGIGMAIRGTMGAITPRKPNTGAGMVNALNNYNAQNNNTISNANGNNANNTISAIRDATMQITSRIETTNALLQKMIDIQLGKVEPDYRRQAAIMGRRALALSRTAMGRLYLNVMRRALGSQGAEFDYRTQAALANGSTSRQEIFFTKIMSVLPGFRTMFGDINKLLTNVIRQKTIFTHETDMSITKVIPEKLEIIGRNVINGFNETTNRLVEIRNNIIALNTVMIAHTQFATQHMRIHQNYMAHATDVMEQQLRLYGANRNQQQELHNLAAEIRATYNQHTNEYNRLSASLNNYYRNNLTLSNVIQEEIEASNAHRRDHNELVRLQLQVQQQQRRDLQNIGHTATDILNETIGFRSIILNWGMNLPNILTRALNTVVKISLGAFVFRNLYTMLSKLFTGSDKAPTTGIMGAMFNATSVSGAIGIAGTIKDYIVGAFQKVIDALDFTDAVNSIKARFNAIFTRENVMSWVGKIGTHIFSIWWTVMGAVNTYQHFIKPVIKNVATGYWNYIKGLFTGTWDALKNARFITPVVKLFGTTYDKLCEWAKNITIKESSFRTIIAESWRGHLTGISKQLIDGSVQLIKKAFIGSNWLGGEINLRNINDKNIQDLRNNLRNTMLYARAYMLNTAVNTNTYDMYKQQIDKASAEISTTTSVGESIKLNIQETKKLLTLKQEELTHTIDEFARNSCIREIKKYENAIKSYTSEYDRLTEDQRNTVEQRGIGGFFRAWRGRAKALAEANTIETHDEQLNYMKKCMEEAQAAGNNDDYKAAQSLWQERYNEIVRPKLDEASAHTMSNAFLRNIKLWKDQLDQKNSIIWRGSKALLSIPKKIGAFFANTIGKIVGNGITNLVGGAFEMLLHNPIMLAQIVTMAWKGIKAAFGAYVNKNFSTEQQNRLGIGGMIANFVSDTLTMLRKAIWKAVVNAPMYIVEGVYGILKGIKDSFVAMFESNNTKMVETLSEETKEKQKSIEDTHKKNLAELRKINNKLPTKTFSETLLESIGDISNQLKSKLGFLKDIYEIFRPKTFGAIGASIAGMFRTLIGFFNKDVYQRKVNEAKGQGISYLSNLKNFLLNNGHNEEELKTIFSNDGRIYKGASSQLYDIIKSHLNENGKILDNSGQEIYSESNFAFWAKTLDDILGEISFDAQEEHLKNIETSTSTSATHLGELLEEWKTSNDPRFKRYAEKTLDEINAFHQRLDSSTSAPSKLADTYKKQQLMSRMSSGDHSAATEFTTGNTSRFRTQYNIANDSKDLESRRIAFSSIDKILKESNNEELSSMTLELAQMHRENGGINMRFKNLSPTQQKLFKHILPQFIDKTINGREITTEDVQSFFRGEKTYGSLVGLDMDTIRSIMREDLSKQYQTWVGNSYLDGNGRLKSIDDIVTMYYYPNKKNKYLEFNDGIGIVNNELGAFSPEKLKTELFLDDVVNGNKFNYTTWFNKANDYIHSQGTFSYKINGNTIPINPIRLLTQAELDELNNITYKGNIADSNNINSIADTLSKTIMTARNRAILLINPLQTFIEQYENNLKSGKKDYIDIMANGRNQIYAKYLPEAMIGKIFKDNFFNDFIDTYVESANKESYMTTLDNKMTQFTRDLGDFVIAKIIADEEGLFTQDDNTVINEDTFNKLNSLASIFNSILNENSTSKITAQDLDAGDPVYGSWQEYYKDKSNMNYIPSSPDWSRYIVSAALATGVDPELISSVIMQESKGRPIAVSPAGAKGLMQMFPAARADVHKFYSASRNYTDFFNPMHSIFLGAYYLKLLTNRYLKGYNWDDIIRGYNWGAGNVKEWRKTGHIIPGYEKKIDANYAANVLQYYGTHKFTDPNMPINRDIYLNKGKVLSATVNGASSSNASYYNFDSAVGEVAKKYINFNGPGTSGSYTNFMMVHPKLRDAFISFAQAWYNSDLPGKPDKKVKITSAWRSKQYQQKLYDNWKAGKSKYPAARPSKIAPHYLGLAIDIPASHANWARSNGLLGAYNLDQPMPGRDPVHIEHKLWSHNRNGTWRLKTFGNYPVDVVQKGHPYIEPIVESMGLSGYNPDLDDWRHPSKDTNEKNTELYKSIFGIDVMKYANALDTGLHKFTSRVFSNSDMNAAGDPVESTISFPNTNKYYSEAIPTGLTIADLPEAAFNARIAEIQLASANNAVANRSVKSIDDRIVQLIAAGNNESNDRLYKEMVKMNRTNEQFLVLLAKLLAKGLPNIVNNINSVNAPTTVSNNNSNVNAVGDSSSGGSMLSWL